MINTESDCSYICSRGILKSCDIHSTNPQSSIKCLLGYEDIVKKINDNSNKKINTLYICSSAIPYFISTIFNSINNKFILVSGDCDEDVPTNIFNSHQSFLNFINNDKIIHWFSQNLVGIHKKLTLIPIGLDYHTMSSRKIFWGPIMNPKDQENLLINIKNSGKHFNQRKVLAYSNFHFALGTKYGFDRKNAIKLVNSILVYYEPSQISREQSWKKQIEYAFILSPHGGGLDCHRTWEALVLGCIPIVKKSPIDELYKDLPVLIVEDWNLLTQELLEETIKKYSTINFNYEKLTLKYWMDLINSHK
jgi:hypothetical protein